jgi:hypothetical protein
MSAHMHQQLSESLLADRSERNFKFWTKRVVDENASLSEIMEIFKEDKTASMLFIWLVGGLFRTQPDFVRPFVSYFYTIRSQIKFPHYERSLAKMFCCCGIPEEIEGEVIRDLFLWMRNVESDISTRSYSIEAIIGQTDAYPELKSELLLHLEDMRGMYSNEFNKNLERWMIELKS